MERPKPAKHKRRLGTLQPRHLVILGLAASLLIMLIGVALFESRTEPLSAASGDASSAEATPLAWCEDNLRRPDDLVKWLDVTTRLFSSWARDRDPRYHDITDLRQAARKQACLLMWDHRPKGD